MVSLSARPSIAYRPPMRRGNSAMPLPTPAGPRIGSRAKDRKSPVRNSSWRMPSRL